MISSRDLFSVRWFRNVFHFQHSDSIQRKSSTKCILKLHKFIVSLPECACERDAATEIKSFLLKYPSLLQIPDTLCQSHVCLWTQKSLNLPTSLFSKRNHESNAAAPHVTDGVVSTTLWFFEMLFVLLVLTSPASRKAVCVWVPNNWEDAPCFSFKV